jgi:hypothetical protein
MSSVTQADLDALVGSYLAGTQRVEYPNQGSVLYRTRDELRQMIREVAAALGVPDPMAPAAGRVASFTIRTSKGLFR